MNTKPKSKTYVYILKNENDGTYWDGSHHYEMSQGGWGNEPTSNGLPKGWRGQAAVLQDTRSIMYLA